MTLLARTGLAAAGFCLALAPAPSAQSLRAAGPPVRLVAEGAAPRWSPDGGRIAFTGPRYAGLWVAQADGSAARQLADWSAAGFGFSWSPDGGALLARPARLDGRDRLNAVAVVDAATGEADLLTDWRAAMPTLPQWTSARTVVLGDGDAPAEALAVERPASVEAGRGVERAAVVAGEDGLVVVEAGRAPRVVAQGRVLNPALSPDGASVAFEEMGGGLVVVRLDGSGRVDLGPGSRPSWSPDGRWVAAQVTTDDGEAFTSAEIVAVRADGSARVQLTSTPGRLETTPAWSPDGRRIAYADLADGALYALPVSE